ncbi:hypothetical protein AVEN_31056-1 [Araneus ventricosus]|uniref:CRAL-TRIO domain-containing protein n=1 Tax=Araneus ventricosus TaxID=182803 RepID=A0A4Y2GHN7_ARAVE|nr:hypothetical protein AVEN_31056-1 [Araneus ventricosus]
MIQKRSIRNEADELSRSRKRLFGFRSVRKIMVFIQPSADNLLRITSPYVTLAFSVVKHVLASALLQKIRFYGAEGYQEDLLQKIDADDLPAFLGGNRTDPDDNPLCPSFQPQSSEERSPRQQSEAEVAILRTITGHDPNPPKGGTSRHRRGGSSLETLLCPPGKREPAYSLGDFSSTHSWCPSVGITVTGKGDVRQSLRSIR